MLALPAGTLGVLASLLHRPLLCCRLPWCSPSWFSGAQSLAVSCESGLWEVNLLRLSVYSLLIDWLGIDFWVGNNFPCVSSHTHMVGNNFPYVFSLLITHTHTSLTHTHTCIFLRMSDNFLGTFSLYSLFLHPAFFCLFCSLCFMIQVSLIRYQSLCFSFTFKSYTQHTEVNSYDSSILSQLCSLSMNIVSQIFTSKSHLPLYGTRSP